MSELKLIDYIRKVLLNGRGDDLERCKMALRGSDLHAYYGASGKTGQQILDEYQEHRDKHLEAEQLFEKMFRIYTIYGDMK